MNGNEDSFSQAFSDFLKRSGRWRDTEPEALVTRWAQFVEACERGYRSDSQDYFNDLTSRDSLERAFAASELQSFHQLQLLRAEVELIDVRFRTLLLANAFPRIPESHWWARGMVKFARKRLVVDMRRNYQLELTEIEPQADQ